MATIYEMASNYPELKKELLSMYDRFMWADLKSYVSEYLDFGDTASEEIKSWMRGYIYRHENEWYVSHKIPQAIIKTTYDLNTFEMTFNGFIEMLTEAQRTILRTSGIVSSKAVRRLSAFRKWIGGRGARIVWICLPDCLK